MAAITASDGKEYGYASNCSHVQVFDAAGNWVYSFWTEQVIDDNAVLAHKRLEETSA